MPTKNNELDIEYRLHTLAIFTARNAAGLPLPERPPGDPWWFEGPHVESGGRHYYVHAMGCFQAELARAMNAHPDWHLIAAVVRRDSVYLRGLDSPRIALAELRTASESLSANEIRLALELTPAEKRKRWGVSDPRPRKNG
jgi:hypothetical protein